jgi:hypothetical protein
MLFKCREKYTMFLSWDKIVYTDDITAFLVNPKLSGPAIFLAGKINDNDNIMLDITSQHVVVLNSWDMIKY